MFFVIKKKHIILVALCCVLIVMGVVSFQFYQRALPTASTNWGLSCLLYTSDAADEL